MFYFLLYNDNMWVLVDDNAKFINFLRDLKIHAHQKVNKCTKKTFEGKFKLSIDALCYACLLVGRRYDTKQRCFILYNRIPGKSIQSTEIARIKIGKELLKYTDRKINGYVFTYHQYERLLEKYK